MDRFLQPQSGVVARRQLRVLGLGDQDVRRLIRRRELVAIHPGVYIRHTGTQAWIEHAWAGVLWASRFAADGTPSAAALCQESALRAVSGPGARDRHDLPIHVIVDGGRALRGREQVLVHRSRHFAQRVVPTSPPRVRFEDAVLDVALAAQDRVSALGVLAWAVGDRRTNAARILAVSRMRSRVEDRAWLENVLHDIDAGTCSVLEHGFISEVVRPHALRMPQLQQREETAIGVVYRDATFDGVNIELDGRLYHSSFSRRDADLDRDLVAATLGQRTVRLGWGQVYRRPCRTAAALAALIGANPRRCSRSACGFAVTR